MKKILLINEGLSDNFGDQAIKLTIEKQLKKKGCQVEFEDFTRNTVKTSYNFYKENHRRKETIVTTSRFRQQLKPIRTFFSRIKWLFNNLKRCKDSINDNEFDVVIIGGGQLILSNRYFPIALLTWVTLIKKLSKSKVVLFGVGCGDKFSFIEKLFIKYSLKKVDEIYIRDSKSKQYLRKVFDVESKLVPDPVLGISKILDDNTNIDNDKVLIGVVNYDVYKRYNGQTLSEKEYLKFWKDKVIEYSAQGREVKLFYTTLADLQQSIILKEQLKEEYNINLSIANVKTLEDLIDEISNSSIVISARMHALIIGRSFGVEVIPYIISDKIKAFKEEYLDDDNARIEDYFQTIDKCLDEVVNLS